MENKNFKDLGISEPILKAIENLRFEEPTEIQRKTIPLVIERKDVIGGSKTGSGKTLAFSCGIIQNTIKGEGVQALILVPTRELAEQVAQAFRSFAKYTGLSVVTVYGGVSINPQIKNLQTADVVVGTPGRILDHLERKTVNFKKVQTLVLDEADMMLDMGFLPDVEKIIKQVSKTRQTLLFSATISNDIYYLKDKYMDNPESVAVEEKVDASLLKQIYYDVPKKSKFALLVHLLKEDKDGLVMVFCNTRMNADFVEKNLRLNKIKARSIHGGHTQSRRTTMLKEFHNGKHQVLVCTDVAARGLDIKGVSHVYNYDTCRDPKQYVHRIGRTARAGMEGKAITLLSQRDYDNFSKVVEVNKMDITPKKLPVFERVIMELAPENDRFSRNRGGRSSGGRSSDRRNSGSSNNRRFERRSTKFDEDVPSRSRDSGDRTRRSPNHGNFGEKSRGNDRSRSSSPRSGSRDSGSRGYGDRSRSSSSRFGSRDSGLRGNDRSRSSSPRSGSRDSGSRGSDRSRSSSSRSGSRDSGSRNFSQRNNRR